MSIFDEPEFSIRLFFPRPADPSVPPGAEDCLVDVGDGVTVHGRIHQASPAKVTVLLFHGNGEVVSDYDDIASAFEALGTSLAVFGYRGYGRSTGRPTLRSALSDSHRILDYMLDRNRGGRQGPLVVMGRSLGSGPAIELAARANGVSGLIIESGYADAYRVAERRGYRRESVSAEDVEVFSNRDKMRRVSAPVLVMHGRNDDLIRFDEAEMNHDAAGSAWKRLVILPGVGHNDVICSPEYFPTIAAFLDETLT